MSQDTPAILMLPGSYSAAVAWAPMMSFCPAHWRMQPETLPGYGGVPEIRSPGKSRVALMTAWIAEKIEEIGEPVHLIGHSYGGLVALAAAFERPELFRSLLTYECNAMAIRQDGRAFEWIDDVKKVPENLRRAFNSNDADAAKVVIDFYGSAGTYDSLPGPVRAFCRSGVEANLLDWESGFAFTPDVSEFEALKMPVTLVCGAMANQPVADMNKALFEILPDARFEIAEGAGHFLISTHPQRCAEIFLDHMARAT